MEKDYMEVLNTYVGCMEEVKRRTNVISSTLKKPSTTGYKYTDAELLCLQYRKILELIALANLVSNKDVYTTTYSNFASHWHAERILRDIEKINPFFYPIPSRQIIDPKTKKVVQVVDIKDGFLTKEEFIIVYKQCSEWMHAENPFITPKNIGKLFAMFRDWLKKIMTLLNHHQIQLIDKKLQIWVVMNAIGDGKVHASLMEQE